MDTLKQMLEKTEQDRDVAVQNYNTLCSQVGRRPTRNILLLIGFLTLYHHQCVTHMVLMSRG